MAGRLKPLDLERLVKPGKFADGGGLYLIVTGPTSKSWSYRYWKDGKERWHGLGSLKEVSLKDARLARDAARLRVKGDRSTAGVDIVQERRKAREEAKAVVAKVVLTFEECDVDVLCYDRFDPAPDTVRSLPLLHPDWLQQIAYVAWP